MRDLEVEIRKQIKCSGRLPVLKGSLKRAPSPLLKAAQWHKKIPCFVESWNNLCCFLHTIGIWQVQRMFCRLTRPSLLKRWKTYTHRRTHSYAHKEAPGDHQRGCYQIWTECIRGFSEKVFLDWFKASLVGHYCGWKNTSPTDDTFDLDALV